MRTPLLSAFMVVVFAAALPAADNRAGAAAFDELIHRNSAALAKRFSPEMSAAMPSEELPEAISSRSGLFPRVSL